MVRIVDFEVSTSISPAKEASKTTISHCSFACEQVCSLSILKQRDAVTMFILVVAVDVHSGAGPWTMWSRVGLRCASEEKAQGLLAAWHLVAPETLRFPGNHAPTPLHTTQPTTPFVAVLHARHSLATPPPHSLLPLVAPPAARAALVSYPLLGGPGH